MVLGVARAERLTPCQPWPQRDALLRTAPSAVRGHAAASGFGDVHRILAAHQHLVRCFLDRRVLAHAAGDGDEDRWRRSEHGRAAALIGRRPRSAAAGRKAGARCAAHDGRGAGAPGRIVRRVPCPPRRATSRRGPATPPAAAGQRGRQRPATLELGRPVGAEDHVGTQSVRSGPIAEVLDCGSPFLLPDRGRRTSLEVGRWSVRLVSSMSGTGAVGQTQGLVRWERFVRCVRRMCCKRVSVWLLAVWS